MNIKILFHDCTMTLKVVSTSMMEHIASLVDSGEACGFEYQQ
jgi:hypothetical protein